MPKFGLQSMILIHSLLVSGRQSKDIFTNPLFIIKQPFLSPLLKPPPTAYRLSTLSTQNTSKIPTMKCRYPHSQTFAHSAKGLKKNLEYKRNCENEGLSFRRTESWAFSSPFYSQISEQYLGMKRHLVNMKLTSKLMNI